MKKRIIVVIVSLISIILLINFNSFKKVLLIDNGGKSYYKAVVSEIEKNNIDENGNRAGNQIVKVKLLNGKYKGKVYQAVSSSSYLYGANCKKGMHVVVAFNKSGDSVNVNVYSFDRSIILLGIILLFFITFCIIGKKQGFKSIVALVITFILLIFLFLPMIYKNYSPIFSAIIFSIITTILTMYLIGGKTKKTLIAIISTVFGVCSAALLAYIFSKIAQINGNNVSDIEQLLVLQQKIGIKVSELLFAGILISSLGAIMDVAMSISSTLYEINSQVENISMKELFKSGLNVGKDMMGTMSNTLILAFCGDSINLLVILYCYNYPSIQLMNMYNIAIEVIKGISATMALILTVPFTALFSSLIYKKSE